MRTVVLYVSPLLWLGFVAWMSDQGLGNHPLALGILLVAPAFVIVLLQQRSWRFWLGVLLGLAPGAALLPWNAESGASSLPLASAQSAFWRFNRSLEPIPRSRSRRPHPCWEIAP